MEDLKLIHSVCREPEAKLAHLFTSDGLKNTIDTVDPGSGCCVIRDRGLRRSTKAWPPPLPLIY